MLEAGQGTVSQASVVIHKCGYLFGRALGRRTGTKD
jgi:hypothetical protein